MCFWFIFTRNMDRGDGSVDIEASPRKWKVGCSNPSRDRPKSLNQVHCSDSSTSKCSTLGVNVTGPRRWPLQTDAPCHSRCGTRKNPHCSIAIGVEHRSKFAAFTGNGEWKILEWDEKLQTNKQTSNMLSGSRFQVMCILFKICCKVYVFLKINCSTCDFMKDWPLEELLDHPEHCLLHFFK